MTAITGETRMTDAAGAPRTHDHPHEHAAVPVAPASSRLVPVPMTDVRIVDGFWAQRQAVNASATFAHALHWMERLGWIGNFDLAAAGDPPPRAGREFADSEIYKLMEGLAWEVARTGDAWAEETFRALTARVVAAQSPDGYLSTRFGGPGQAARYSDLEWGHELYCAGHLIQAAVARLRTAGEDDLTRAARRVADHIVAEFGPDGRDAVCGHPEIEVALAELSRATGDDRYRAQAALFVERRGAGRLRDAEIGSEYFQDDVPVRDATVLRGHAVRALYLSAGAYDVAIDGGDDALRAAVEGQWDATVARRTYLTGGMGSRHEGESFGDDFELPSDRAYSETCAGIASVMLSWRLLLQSGDARHADLMERTLYNVVATGPDEAGTAFFYVNPLARTVPGTPTSADEPSARAASSQRAPWFEVSCCPTNIARTVASLGAYVATVDDGGLQLHQYASSEIATRLPDGSAVRLAVRTGYPVDGAVEIEVLEAPVRAWDLTVRIPGWGAGATIESNGVRRAVEPGYVVAASGLAAGAIVRLELPIAPRITLPDPRIDAVRHTAAVEAGPLVYCLESVDAGTEELARLRLDPTVPPRRGEGDTVEVLVADEAIPGAPWPYGPDGSASPAGREPLMLVPYHRWAERGPSTMRVWLPLPEQPAGH
jgi:uncharacterized protein